MFNPQAMLEQLLADPKNALALVIALPGSTARTVRAGALMAVFADGRFSGGFAESCLDAAIAAEAADLALQATGPARIIVGDGGARIDLRLPCAGRLDLLIVPVGDHLPVIATHARRMKARLSSSLLIPLDGQTAITEQVGHHHTQRTVMTETALVLDHIPAPQAIVIGTGRTASLLLSLCDDIGMMSRCISPEQPDPRWRRTTQGRPVDNDRIATHWPDAGQPCDQWTAIICLSHEHDWAMPMVAAALQSPAFYVGAMGSAATSAARRVGLTRIGVSAPALDRLTSPIGIVPAARSPELLALSVLTEIMARFDQRFLANPGRCDG